MRKGFYLLLLMLLPCAFATAQISQLLSPGALSRAHDKYSGVKNCGACHESDKNVLDAKCLACHKQLAARISAHQGYHADKTANCASCHRDHAGKDHDIRGLDLSTFSHEKTGYRLDGLHQKITDCKACHKDRSFLKVSRDCRSCHRDPHQGRLTDCQSCHSTDRPMKDVRFNHASTSYPLTGSHANVKCYACHKNQVYKGLAFNNCWSCHKDPHKSLLGRDCVRCHSGSDAWKSVVVKHVAFPLQGKHSSVACQKCHQDGKWKIARFSACRDCHRDPHIGQFQQACETCHSPDGWKPAHAKHEEYKLEAKHKSVDCKKCHPTEKGSFPAGTGVAVRYRPLKTDCVSCHKDIHGSQLGVKCQDCHATESFKVVHFDHSRARYPLDTVHSKVACEKCHRTESPVAKMVRYKGLDTKCEGCHNDVHLGQLGKDCTRCHTPQGMKFDHATASYPLTGKHAKVECSKCHKKEQGAYPASKAGTAVRYKPLSAKCASCHEDYHRGQFSGKDCALCHTAASFKPTIFTHRKSGYPLNGAHARLACVKCHKTVRFDSPAPSVELVRYSPMSQDCGSCHKDPHKGGRGDNCGVCHTESKWSAVSRGFHQTGVFPLEGRHLSVSCEACHIKKVFRGTAGTCYDCHWIRRQDDRYRTKFGSQCEACHQPSSWSNVRWDHAEKTGIALNGFHRALACDSCHLRQEFVAGEVQCFACHRADYQNASNPNHAAAGFPTQCQSCHRPSDNGWDAAPIDHAGIFPLRGVHATQPCAACHKGNIAYNQTPHDCYGCHRTQYEQSGSPNHIAAGMSRACEGCHNYADSGWNQARFNHSGYFQLIGVHATQPCSACHKNNIYKGTPRNCYGCHRTQYEQTRNPNHLQGGFSTHCESCHKASDADWRSKNFDHASVFPLVGVHAVQACSACHKNGKYKGTPRQCYGCHKVDYEQTGNPNHLTSGFSIHCDSCHKSSDAAWNRANFRHDSVFQLVGAHAVQPCQACHKNGVYKGTPRNCYGCHRANYEQTKDPNHQTAGFPTGCEACHRPSDANWHQAKFNHGSFFQLVGVHQTQPCAACHKGGQYKGTPRDCYGCHRAAYEGTTDPNHRNAGFPTDCTACHRAADANWHQAKFNHNTFFQLVGVHATIACNACHPNEHYKGTPRDCYGCHRSDYEHTTDPNHVAAGFPTTCETCHRASDTSFHQGVFNHTWFPITSGRHSGFPCSSCHVNPSNYAVFSCFACHPQGETDSHHSGVAGYRYDSNACYSCHPHGSAD